MSLGSKLVSLIGSGQGITKLGEKIIESRFTEQERSEMDMKALEQAEQARAGSEELDNDEFMKQLELHYQQEELYQKDRENARNRELEIAKLSSSSWIQKNISHIVALIFTLFGFTVILLLLMGQVTLKDEVLKGRVMAIAEYFLVSVLSYYVGSSMGSARKQDTLDRRDK